MKTREEIVASKLYDMLSDIRLDPFLVGRYFAQTARTEVYDNLEEMIESARQEKQHRIEWLKKTILGDKTVTTTFDKKCEILAELWVDYSGDPEWEDFFDLYDLGLPLAFAMVKDLVVGLSPAGEEYIDHAFGELLTVLDIEDTGFDSLSQLVDS